jgi:hypothetical protein
VLAFHFLFGARFRKSDGTIGFGALGKLCLSAGIWRLNGRAYYTMLHITSRNFPFQSSSYCTLPFEGIGMSKTLRSEFSRLIATWAPLVAAGEPKRGVAGGAVLWCLDA